MKQIHRAAFAFAILVLIILTSGCLKNIKSSQDYSVKYANNLSKFTLFDEGAMGECKLGTCVCMVCQNGSSWFGFTTSLVGGNCSFVKDCDAAKFRTLVNKTLTPNSFPRQFMVGQGYSFNDFANANPYCGNRLDTSVQWLIGSNTTNYSLPDPDRSLCMLDKGVMPVYVLYSEGKNINPIQTRKIASLLAKGGPSKTFAKTLSGGPVGPVIIVTEMDFNSSDDRAEGAVANVTEQIREINAQCNDRVTGQINCLVALGVQMGDYDGVRKILIDNNMKDEVDLIAFGLNAHTANLSASRDIYCNPIILFNQGWEFARFSLYNYSKPTIVPYIMLDSQGMDGSKSCNWTELKMVEGYKSFFLPPTAHIFKYQKAGVIGVAPYDFNSSSFSTTNPLNCIDCALGKNDLRMQSWFAPCKAYKVLANKSPVGDNMIVFSNESGGNCDYSVNPVGILQMGMGQNFNTITPELQEPDESYFRCDACISENGSYTFGGLAPVTLNSEFCTKFPALDMYAGQRDIDPMLIRAIAYAESGFDPCVAGLIDGECNGGSAGYDYVIDPEGICHYADSKTNSKTKRYCGLGLMQGLEAPFTFWPSEWSSTGTAGIYYTGAPDNHLFLEAQMGGRSGYYDAARACSPYYNPFNASHSACVGTYIYADKYASAKALVEKNRDVLFGQTSNPGYEKAVTTYIALNFYRGYNVAQTWINNYNFDKNQVYDSVNDVDNIIAKNCYGKKDFVQYVRECDFQRTLPGKPDYASRVLSYYLGFQKNCPNASCPTGKKLADAACVVPPANGLPTYFAGLFGDKCVKKK